MDIKLNNSLIEQLNKPIDFKYQKPSAEEVEAIKSASGICIINKASNILPINTYYQDGIKGTYPDIFTRHIILQRVQQIADKLVPDYGLMVFDAYRSINAQIGLFDLVCKEISKQHPDWSEAEAEREARKYAAHPSDKSHYIIAPHNSGGAIDLAIYDVKSKKMCFFGTEFDDAGELSKTDFFESEFNSKFGFSSTQWQTIRTNRRLLFNLMKEVGFVNYPNEWWHYDLGDCIWSKELGIDWMFDVIDDNDV